MTVSATGTASGTPDTVTINIGATTDAATAASALDKNDAEMATLTQLFVAAESQTGGPADKWALCQPELQLDEHGDEL